MKLQRVGAHVDNDRRQPRTRGIGEIEPGGVYREGVRQRRAREQRKRRSLIIPGVDRPRRPDRAIALAREDLRAGPMDLDLNRAELAVGDRVPRRVAEQVVELVVLVDPLERRARVVGLLDEEPAGVLGSRARPVRESSFIVSSTRSNAIVSGWSVRLEPVAT